MQLRFTILGLSVGLIVGCSSIFPTPLFLTYHNGLNDCARHETQSGCLASAKAHCLWIPVNESSSTNNNGSQDQHQQHICVFPDYQTVDCSLYDNSSDTCNNINDKTSCVYRFQNDKCIHQAGFTNVETGVFSASTVLGGTFLGPFLMGKYDARFGNFQTLITLAIISLLSSILFTIGIENGELGLWSSAKILSSITGFSAAALFPSIMGRNSKLSLPKKQVITRGLGMCISIGGLAVNLFLYLDMPRGQFTEDPVFKIRLQNHNIVQWLISVFFFVFALQIKYPKFFDEKICNCCCVPSEVEESDRRKVVENKIKKTVIFASTVIIPAVDEEDEDAVVTPNIDDNEKEHSNIETTTADENLATQEEMKDINANNDEKVADPASDKYIIKEDEDGSSSDSSSDEEGAENKLRQNSSSTNLLNNSLTASHSALTATSPPRSRLPSVKSFESNDSHFDGASSYNEPTSTCDMTNFSSPQRHHHTPHRHHHRRTSSLGSQSSLNTLRGHHHNSEATAAAVKAANEQRLEEVQVTDKEDPELDFQKKIQWVSAIAICCLQQFVGLGVVASYVPIILQDLIEDPLLAQLAFSASFCVGAIVSVTFISRFFTPIQIYVAGGIACAVAAALIGLSLHPTALEKEAAQILSLVALVMYALTFAAGLSAMYYASLADSFTIPGTLVTGMTVSAGFAVSCQVFVRLIFPLFVAEISSDPREGRSWAFFGFSGLGFCFAATVLFVRSFIKPEYSY